MDSLEQDIGNELISSTRHATNILYRALNELFKYQEEGAIPISFIDWSAATGVHRQTLWRWKTPENEHRLISWPLLIAMTWGLLWSDRETYNPIACIREFSKHYYFCVIQEESPVKEYERAPARHKHEHYKELPTQVEQLFLFIDAAFLYARARKNYRLIDIARRAYVTRALISDLATKKAENYMIDENLPSWPNIIALFWAIYQDEEDLYIYQTIYQCQLLYASAVALKKQPGKKRTTEVTIPRIKIADTR